MITQERLKELLMYDEESGVFTNRTSRARCIRVGDIAGSHHKDGYLHLMLDGKKYLCHRLAWLYVYGYFPEYQIDHKNRARSDNRIKNLREASQSCNSRNSKTSSINTSGVVGVSRVKGSGLWCARIGDGARRCYLKQTPDFIEACAYRLAGEQAEEYETCRLGTSTSLKVIEEWAQRG